MQVIDLTARMCPKKKIGFRPAHKKKLVRDSELHGSQVGCGGSACGKAGCAQIDEAAN